MVLQLLDGVSMRTQSWHSNLLDGVPIRGCIGDALKVWGVAFG
jgi:hypothetical protein